MHHQQHSYVVEAKVGPRYRSDAHFALFSDYKLQEEEPPPKRHRSDGASLAAPGMDVLRQAQAILGELDDTEVAHATETGEVKVNVSAAIKFWSSGAASSSGPVPREPIALADVPAPPPPPKSAPITTETMAAPQQQPAKQVTPWASSEGFVPPPLPMPPNVTLETVIANLRPTPPPKARPQQLQTAWQTAAVAQQKPQVLGPPVMRRRVEWHIDAPQQQQAAQAMPEPASGAAKAFSPQATAPQGVFTQTAFRPTFQPSSPEPQQMQEADASALLRPAHLPSSPQQPPMPQDGSYRLPSFGRPDVLQPQARAPQEIAPQLALQPALQPAGHPSSPEQQPVPLESSASAWQPLGTTATAPQVATVAMQPGTAATEFVQPPPQHAAQAPLPPPPLVGAAVLAPRTQATAPQEVGPHPAFQDAPRPSLPAPLPPPPLWAAAEPAAHKSTPQPAFHQARQVSSAEPLLPPPPLERTAALPQRATAAAPHEVDQQPELQPTPQPAPLYSQEFSAKWAAVLPRLAATAAPERVAPQPELQPVPQPMPSSPAPLHPQQQSLWAAGLPHVSAAAAPQEAAPQRALLLAPEPSSPALVPSSRPSFEWATAPQLVAAGAPQEAVPQPALLVPSSQPPSELAAALPQLPAAVAPQEAAPQPALELAPRPSSQAILIGPQPLDGATALPPLATAGVPQEVVPQLAQQPATPPVPQPSSPELPLQQEAMSYSQLRCPVPLESSQSPPSERVAYASQPHAAEPLEAASQQELQPAPQLAPRPSSPVALSQSKQSESAAPLPFERDVAMGGDTDEEPDWGGMDLEIEDARDRAKVCSGGCVGYGCEASPAALKRTHHSAPAGHQTSSSIKLRFTVRSGFSDLSCHMNI